MGEWCTIPLHRIKPFVKKPVYPTELIIKEHKGLSSPCILLLTLCSLHSNIHVITVQTMPVCKFKEVGWSSNSPSDLLTSYQNHEMICLAKNYFLFFFIKSMHVFYILNFVIFLCFFNRALLRQEINTV